MKKVCSQMMRWVPLAVLLLWVVPARGMMMQIDGHASLSIVLVTDSTLVCTSSVSGATNDMLLGLDALTGKLKWRVPIVEVRGSGSSMPTNEFLLVANHFLERRSLETGKAVWRTRLDTIAQQKTVPPVKLKDQAWELLEKTVLAGRPKVWTVKIGMVAGPPNRYWYHGPIRIGSQILLTREALNGSGCTYINCFDDWLLFEAATGKLVRGGSGALLGRTRQSAVVGDDNGVFNLDGSEAAAIKNVKPTRGPFGSLAGLEQWSLDERCIFEARNDKGEKQLVHFDASSGKLRRFPYPLTRTNFVDSWVLVDETVLRYAEYFSSGSAPVLAKGNPWFELYDQKGTLQKSVEVRVAGRENDWGRVRFVQRKPGGILFETDGRYFEVAVPSLAVTPCVPSAEAKAQYQFQIDETSLSPSKTVGYASYGNTNLFEMKRDAVVHRIGVVARSAATGKTFWTYGENIVIQKGK